MNSTIIFFILIAAIFVVLLFITIFLFLRNQSLKKELTQNNEELNNCYANLDELHPQLEQARICAEKLTFIRKTRTTKSRICQTGTEKCAIFRFNV